MTTNGGKGGDAGGRGPDGILYKSSGATVIGREGGVLNAEEQDVYKRQVWMRSFRITQ